MPFAIRSVQYVEAAGTSAGFTNPMQPGYTYRFTSETNCWVKVTTTGGSAAANTADNIFYVKGQTLYLANPDSNGTTNSFVKVIQDAAGGACTLALIEPV